LFQPNFIPTSQATLVARAQNGIWMSEACDMRVADVYPPPSVSLSASGAIIDARGERTRSIETDGVTLTALGGAVGSELNPMLVKSSLSSGVNASSTRGYSIFLQGAETGLTVGNYLTTGLDLDLYAAQGGLRAVGKTMALGRIDAEASGTGDFTMTTGTTLEALTGDIYVAADDVGLSELDASRGERGPTQCDADGSLLHRHNGQGGGRAGQGWHEAGDDRGRQCLSGAGHLVAADRAVSAVGNAVISSRYSILDDRGACTQAEDSTNISFAAGGDVLSAVAGGAVSLGRSSSVLLRVRSATVAEGASADGKAWTVVLTAAGDITFTGIRSAIVVSTTAGSVLDGGDSAADMPVTNATGGIVVIAQGGVGNTALASSARGRSIETDAASLVVTRKTDSVALAHTRTTREVVESASKKAELTAQGSEVCQGGLVAGRCGRVEYNRWRQACEYRVGPGCDQ